MAKSSLPTGIRKRGDGQYQVRLNRKGFPPVTETFFTLAEAERFRAKVLTEMSEGRLESWRPTTDVKLSDWLIQYYEEVAQFEKQFKQKKSKRDVLLASWLAKEDPNKITYLHINRYIQERIRDGVMPETVHKDLNYLSKVYQWAKHTKGGWTTFNPVQEAQRPSRSKGRKRRVLEDKRLGKTETQYIMENTGSVHLSLWLILAEETAMRRAEIGKVTVGTINFEDCYIDLRDNKNDEDRFVPLSPKAMELIQKLVKETDPSDTPLFNAALDTITQAFGRARERAHAKYLKDCSERTIAPRKDFLVDLRLHDYRHEATSKLFERGDLDMMEVASITGHKDLRSLKGYTHHVASRIAKKLAGKV